MKNNIKNLAIINKQRYEDGDRFSEDLINNHEMSIHFSRAKTLGQEIRNSKTSANKLLDDVEDHVNLIKIGAFENMAKYNDGCAQNCPTITHQTQKNQARNIIKSLGHIYDQEE